MLDFYDNNDDFIIRNEIILLFKCIYRPRYSRMDQVKLVEDSP